jgi:hypothetical protein
VIRHFLLIGSFLLTGCAWWQTDSVQDDAVARVGGYYLYQADLEGLVPEGSDEDDSVAITRTYVDAWVKEHLILTEAEARLSGDQKDFSQKLEEYRQSLLRYRYESDVITPQIDTSVDEELIRTYFAANKAHFQLRRPIMQGRYVKIALQAPRQEQLKKWLSSKRPRDVKELEEYCLQYAFQSHLTDSMWVFTDDILRAVPADVQSQFDFLATLALQQAEDSLHRYYLYLRQARGTGQEPPLSFEEQNIRSLILLQRRQEYIQRYYQELFRKATENKQYEIYGME